MKKREKSGKTTAVVPRGNSVSRVGRLSVKAEQAFVRLFDAAFAAKGLVSPGSAAQAEFEAAVKDAEPFVELVRELED